MYSALVIARLLPFWLGPQIPMRISATSCLIDEAHEGLHSLPVSQNLQTQDFVPFQGPPKASSVVVVTLAVHEIVGDCFQLVSTFRMKGKYVRRLT